jgi:hypothetical protein
MVVNIYGMRSCAAQLWHSFPQIPLLQDFNTSMAYFLHGSEVKSLLDEQAFSGDSKDLDS